MSLLREGLLDGLGVALAGGVADQVSGLLAALGARLEVVPLEADLDAGEDQAGAWARARAPLHGLLYDASAEFGAGGPAGVRAALDAAWVAIREVALGALIPSTQGGKVVLLGPRPDRGRDAEGARTGLENLARTLSVEWARYGITTTALAPGACTGDEEIAELVAYVLSRGGDYLSGCRLEMGVLRGPDEAKWLRRGP